MKRRNLIFIDWFVLLFLIFLLSGCGSCSRSGLSSRYASGSDELPSDEDTLNDSEVKSSGRNIVRMEDENGVKYLWVEINGLRLKFIFDTGASSICISAAEATVLYRQGTLTKDDFLDIQYFQDATGRVSAGARINLRTVKIGNRVLKNIESIVIDNNEAPLLLGQSALEKFGKISIDNQRNLIIFE